MKLNNKRGVISAEVLYMIPKIVFLIAVLFAVVILVKIFIITNTDVREVESNILIARILYSKDGISYFDDTTKRLYPGIVDFKKFEQLSAGNPNLLDSFVITYGSDNPIIAAKITLKQKNGDSIEVFYNKDRFDKWEPRALSTVKGGLGSVKSFKDQKYVLVKNDQDLVPAILEFYTVG